MATLYLSDDNTLNYTKKSVLMKRSNLVDELNILVPKYYNSIDMSDGFDVYLHYITPISRQHKLLQLTLDNDNYTGTETEEDIVLSYKIPLTLEFTMEEGNLEVWLAFYKIDVSVNEETDELELNAPYRVSTNCFVKIYQTSDYDNLMLNTENVSINNKIEELKLLIQQLDAANQELADRVPTDIKFVEEDENMHLVNSDDDKLGNGIDTVELGNAIGQNISVEDEDDGTPDGIYNVDAVYNVVY